MQVTIEQIKKAYQNKGYVYNSTEKDYTINVFGIRSSDMTPNIFNDIVGIIYFKSNQWFIKTFKATTDAGLYWLNNPINVKGTAILKAAQYLKVYKYGFHKGYPAAEQIGPMLYYRDSNRNNYFDLSGPIEKAINKTNIHHAGVNSTKVDKWSAGCQVIASITEWDEFISIFKLGYMANGIQNYTLFNENEI